MTSRDDILHLMAETIQERRQAIYATAKSTQEYEKAEFGQGYSIITTEEALKQKQ